MNVDETEVTGRQRPQALNQTLNRIGRFGGCKVVVSGISASQSCQKRALFDGSFGKFKYRSGQFETSREKNSQKHRRQTACRVYFGENRIGYTKRQRRAVYEWIRNLAVDISERAGLNTISSLAWRVAAKKWLEKNRLITILKPGKVLPNFPSNLCHN